MPGAGGARTPRSAGAAAAAALRIPVDELLMGLARGGSGCTESSGTAWGCQPCGFQHLKSFLGAAPEIALGTSPGKEREHVLCCPNFEGPLRVLQ